jgi:hypothetical protein
MTTLLPNGIFVRGVVVSVRARPLKRKDGSGISVIIETEIATQPGVVTWTRFVDPATDKSVRIEGDNVVEFPKLREFQQVTIRASSLKSDERTGQLVIRAGELVA